MVDQQSQDGSWNDEELYLEVVNVIANGALVLHQGQVNVGHTADDEEDLDASVVKGNEIEEQVNVSCEENQQVEDLCPS